METINLGDKVKIKDRSDWPANPKYRFAGAQGQIVRLYDESFAEIRMLMHVDGVRDGSCLSFTLDSLEKV